MEGKKEGKDKRGREERRKGNKKRKEGKRYFPFLNLSADITSFDSCNRHA